MLKRNLYGVQTHPLHLLFLKLQGKILEIPSCRRRVSTHPRNFLLFFKIRAHFLRSLLQITSLSFLRYSCFSLCLPVLSLVLKYIQWNHTAVILVDRMYGLCGMFRGCYSHDLHSCQGPGSFGSKTSEEMPRVWNFAMAIPTCEWVGASFIHIYSVYTVLSPL